MHSFFTRSADLARPHAVRAISLFAPLLVHTTENALVLVVEAIEAALRAGGDALDAGDAHTVFNALLDVWQANAADPTMDGAIGDVLAALAARRTPAAERALVGLVLPRLANALAASADSPLPAAAASMLDSVTTERAAPLGAGFFAAFAGPLFSVLDATDDRQILQDGLSVLTQVVRTECAQLLQWRDGATGLDRVLGLLGKTLDASQPESGGLFVGDLVIHLLRTAGDAVLPVLPDLLRALLARLPSAQTASFAQSLILPFAYLMYTQLDTVLDLVEATPVEGRTGADVLAAAWCEHAETIQGYWNRRISTVGLARLFVARRPAWERLAVKGDLVVDPHARDVIMTRARRKQHPDRYTTVALPAKLLALLARELVGMREDDGHVAAPDSDDDGDGWEADDDGFSHATERALADLKGDLLDDALDHQADDADLRADPLYAIDLAGYIAAALRQAIADDAERVQRLAAGLTPDESEALRRAVG